jgi:hypothetical protein
MGQVIPAAARQPNSDATRWTRSHWPHNRKTVSQDPGAVHRGALGHAGEPEHGLPGRLPGGQKRRGVPRWRRVGFTGERPDVDPADAPPRQESGRTTRPDVTMTIRTKIQGRGVPRALMAAPGLVGDVLEVERVHRALQVCRSPISPSLTVTMSTPPSAMAVRALGSPGG